MHLVVDPSVAQSWMGSHWAIRFWIWNRHHLASWTRFPKVSSFQTWQRISAKVQVPSSNIADFFLILSTYFFVFNLYLWLYHVLDFFSAEMTTFLTSETNNFSDSTGGDHTGDCWIILLPFFFITTPWIDVLLSLLFTVPIENGFHAFIGLANIVSLCVLVSAWAGVVAAII